MSDRELLLFAILAEPAEDTPRLVYADFLQEQGEDDLAKFIRIQCEISRLRSADNPECTSGSATWCPVCGDCTCASREESMSDPGCPLHDPDNSQHDLRGHADYLAYKDGELFYVLPFDEIIGANKPLQGLRRSTEELALCGLSRKGLVTRGFVSRIEMRCEAFLSHAPAIFAAHPVTEARISDKRPYYNGCEYCFYRESRTRPSQHVPTVAIIPDALFSAIWGNVRLKGFAASTDGERCLAGGAVAYGRTLAGLPEFTEDAYSCSSHTKLIKKKVSSVT